MTPRQAAEIIGCTPQQVRTLIRQGKIKAKQQLSPVNKGGYHYEIPTKEVERYANKPITRGRPRKHAKEV